MTEEEAREWLGDYVPRETFQRLEAFVALIRAGMANQNLISAASAEHIWARHIVDSAQLLQLDTNSKSGPWIDVGTGGGFPGMVVAIAGERWVIMVEPRPKRAEFLQRAADELNLRTTIITGKVDKVRTKAAVVSGRAVSPATTFLEWTEHLASSETLWLLPKGRSAQSELAEAERAWQGVFHVKQSVTDPDSGIIVAYNVRRRRT